MNIQSGTATTTLAPANPWALVPPLGNLDAYISAVNRLPLLTHEEEQTYARQLKDNNDLDAAGRLVMSHLRLVVSIARQYLGYGLPHGDLIQEGNVGLMKAVKRFDPDQGVRLVSYAMHWIKAEIHEYILKNWRMVKVATTKAQRKLLFNLRSMKQGFKADASAADAATHRDTLSDHEMDTVAAQLNVKREPRATDGIAPALGSLDDRSRRIVEERWLKVNDDGTGGMTLHELAAVYGVSAERIRQIEVAAMKKMKKALAGDARP